MESEKHFGLRIDDTLLTKVHYVCAYEGRSVNAQILFLLRQCVADFEKEHGKISTSDK
ncbi:MAG: hypothetical protein GX051_09360 [Clostridiales bacterium]|nr:hypothetical protein [Clostridiales bacterium]